MKVEVEVEVAERKFSGSPSLRYSGERGNAVKHLFSEN